MTRESANLSEDGVRPEMRQTSRIIHIQKYALSFLHFSKAL